MEEISPASFALSCAATACAKNRRNSFFDFNGARAAEYRPWVFEFVEGHVFDPADFWNSQRRRLSA